MKVMRKIIASKTFRRDVKKHYMHLLSPEWREVFSALVYDTSLPERCRDHALSGEFKGYRNCHIKPDLLLIYRIADDDALERVRLDSHSEIFG